ncbi:MAG: hypothetical protein MHPSP_001571, partial [Paramarteilia canceri]
SFLYALKKIKERAKSLDVSMFKYIKNSIEPSSNVVLFEDSASLIGLVIAATSIYLTQLFKIPEIDAIGSLAIGTLLSVVAYIIVRENVSILIGKAITPGLKMNIISDLEGLRVVR